MPSHAGRLFLKAWCDSAMEDIYLDYASTTPVHAEVLEAMVPYFSTFFGNPSNFHSKGEEAHAALEEARVGIANFMGAHPGDTFFCGGGTEANNLIIKGIAFANKGSGNHIITTSIEHHSVIHTCRFLEENGFRVTYLPADKYGMVKPHLAERAITDKTILISVMHANNEVGTIEPIAEIGGIARGRKIPFHTDAVQTFGHIPVDVNDLCVDALSASAHKLYGPKGVGIAYVRKGIRVAPVLHGGRQESGFRAGTENVPGIIGFGKAVEIARQRMEEESKKVSRLRKKLVDGLFETIEGIRINGHPAIRLPNNVNVSIEGVEGERILMALRLEGICASNGSACNSSSKEPSHVLLSMGVSPDSCRNSLRFTLGSFTTDEEVDFLIHILGQEVKRHRKRAEPVMVSTNFSNR